MEYKTSGVDTDKANLLAYNLQKSFASDNFKNFAGVYEHPHLNEYYLVGCSDGVGSKIIPLIDNNLIESIALDLIAMNLNDMACMGAKPMFFLDYIAVNSLSVDLITEFIKYLKLHLEKYNCQLLGGETAELPDLITKNYFDVSASAVGIVRKDSMLSIDNTRPGDVVIGLASNGPHSNGFSLIRKLHKANLLNNDDLLETLKPTYIYINEIISLCESTLINSCAHITGGGIVDNIIRVIPEHLSVELDNSKIPKQKVFIKIKDIIGKQESYKIFNMGVGMVLIAKNENADKIMKICQRYNPFIYGEIKENKGNETSSRVRLR